MVFVSLTIALNNIGATHYNGNDLEIASERYNDALSALVAGVQVENSVSAESSDVERDYLHRRLENLIDQEETPAGQSVANSTSFDLNYVHGEKNHQLSTKPIFITQDTPLSTRGLSIIVLHNKGLLQRRVGDNNGALSLFKMSLGLMVSIAHHVKSTYVEVVTTTLLQIGQIYFDLGQYDEASHFFSEALIEANRSKQESEQQAANNESHHIDVSHNQNKILSSMARTLSHLGKIHFYFGQYDEAIEFCKGALLYQQKLKHIQGHAPMMSSLYNIGMALYFQGETENAVQYIQWFITEAQNHCGMNDSQIEDAKIILNNMYLKCNEYANMKISAAAA